MWMLDNNTTEIRGYSTEKRIVDRFGVGKYSVKFGLGLHVGWAIEGPIGSDYKVDASYLSPHVNLSMVLEGKIGSSPASSK